MIPKATERLIAKVEEMVQMMSSPGGQWLGGVTIASRLTDIRLALSTAMAYGEQIKSHAHLRQLAELKVEAAAENIRLAKGFSEHDKAMEAYRVASKELASLVRDLQS